MTDVLVSYRGQWLTLLWYYYVKLLPSLNKGNEEAAHSLAHEMHAPQFYREGVQIERVNRITLLDELVITDLFRYPAEATAPARNRHYLQSFYYGRNTFTQFLPDKNLLSPCLRIIRFCCFPAEIAAGSGSGFTTF